jgi:cell division protein FtsN
MQKTLLLLPLLVTALLQANDEAISLEESLKLDAERYEAAQLKIEEERYDQIIANEDELSEAEVAADPAIQEEETENKDRELTPEEQALKEMNQEVADAEEQQLKEVGAGEVELEFKEDEPEEEKSTEENETDTQEESSSEETSETPEEGQEEENQEEE